MSMYNLFTMRQASRRAWRLGQDQPCKVFYYYYADTMQARAMTLMGKKLTAAQAIEGKFSAEGLAAMAGDDGTMEMALARSLVEKLEDLDAAREWQRLSTGYKPQLVLPDPPQLLLPPERIVIPPPDRGRKRRPIDPRQKSLFELVA